MNEVRVRYRDAPEKALVVTLIHTWKRSDPEIQEPMVMSTSGGPKDTIRNYVHTIFDHDHAVDAVSMVRGNGPFFLIIRKGSSYFDVSHKEVEVAQKRAANPAAPQAPVSRSA